ncbi:hypothetical protein CDAR_616401 [Caerostris darwini]|uniref:Uncharacterized protein n=1 Tax=Caerostris darwini TaxID=1538125 RepID=A0AAV4NEA0_9ARAC|nr:hypothetical protein CDAR_616401 [Caerostris darwini]
METPSVVKIATEEVVNLALLIETTEIIGFTPTSKILLEPATMQIELANGKEALMWCTGVKTGRESQIPPILKPLTPTLTVQQHLTAEKPGTDVIGLYLFQPLDVAP